VDLNAAAFPGWLEAHRDLPFARLLDHTLLRPDATVSDIGRLCDQAMRIGAGHVCVNGQWVAAAADRLRHSGTGVAAVIGFPLGATGEAAKVEEARLATNAGAGELDVVIALGWARAGRWDLVEQEVAAVVDAAGGAGVKVIIEAAALEVAEIELACRAAVEAGASFVKTSTGFHPSGGATPEAVRLMRRTVGARAGVKASGGIRTLDDALTFLSAGADRIGASGAADWPVTALARSVGDLLSL
jgi:deoxyribose-phosphate aldolase